jgi:hypothetical protein
MDVVPRRELDPRCRRFTVLAVVRPCSSLFGKMCGPVLVVCWEDRHQCSCRGWPWWSGTSIFVRHTMATPLPMLLCHGCPCLLCHAFLTSNSACSIVDAAPSSHLTRQTPSRRASCATCSAKCETRPSTCWPSLGIRHCHRFNRGMLDETSDTQNCHHSNSFVASCVPAD